MVRQSQGASSHKHRKGICTASKQGMPAGSLASCQAPRKHSLVVALMILRHHEPLANSANAMQNANEFALLPAWHSIALPCHGHTTYLLNVFFCVLGCFVFCFVLISWETLDPLNNPEKKN